MTFARKKDILFRLGKGGNSTLARKKGTPKLELQKILELIDAGKILTRRLGKAPLWVVTASYPRMGVGIGKILVPDVSRKIFYVLDGIDKLLEQQQEILQDTYALGEVPEMTDVFETLVRLTHLGPQNRLDLPTSQKVAAEFSKLAIRIERHSESREKIHESISRIIQAIIRGLTTRTIRGKVSTAIEIVVARMSQVETIIPLIELRRSAALQEIIRQERALWKIAYELKTRVKTLGAKNITAALRRDLETIRVPDVQPYRRKVQNAKRTMVLARTALAQHRYQLAQKYLEHAIRILGYSPEDLSPLEKPPLS